MGYFVSLLNKESPFNLGSLKLPPPGFNPPSPYVLLAVHLKPQQEATQK